MAVDMRAVRGVSGRSVPGFRVGAGRPENARWSGFAGCPVSSAQRVEAWRAHALVPAAPRAVLKPHQICLVRFLAVPGEQQDKQLKPDREQPGPQRRSCLTGQIGPVTQPLQLVGELSGQTCEASVNRASGDGQPCQGSPHKLGILPALADDALGNVPGLLLRLPTLVVAVVVERLPALGLQ